MNTTAASRTTDPEAILRRLFVGASVSGLRFGVLQLIFDSAETPGEPYLNLASSWRTYSARPDRFQDIDQSNEEEAESEIQRATTLRHKQVADVEVLEPWPHLIMTFTDGTLLYLNGKDEQHEPWTAGLSQVPLDQQVQVIACPGGELAFILPRGGRNHDA